MEKLNIKKNPIYLLLANKVNQSIETSEINKRFFSFAFWILQ